MATLPHLIAELRTQFLHELKSAFTSKDLEAVKVKYLGKKGPVQGLMQELRHVGLEERPHFGKLINDLKEELTSHCDHTFSRLQEEELQTRFSLEALDPTLPGRRPPLGRIHPTIQMIQKILDILIGMGFSVRLGPNIETDHYNFGALNFGSDHPARDMQDTFYLDPHHLLRTHCTNVQARSLKAFEPPMRIVAPGRCFRNEDISSRSHVFFHQIDGFYVDRKVSFADLMATMNEFIRKLFGENAETRFRPSYFPFVEPGMEVDARCTVCGGAGCRLCKHTGWLEILGAGMIHPNVLKEAGIDSEEYSGYAWGMGIERLSILAHDIPDIRLFTENDIRFLEQFS